MKQSLAKAIFWGGTLISALIFLALTYNSISKMPERTHEENITPQVAAGKWVWQKNNCNDCHTILGIGGYYAPDLTKVAGSRDPEWTKNFLKDPEKIWPANRKMPNLHLKDDEIAELVEFLIWVNGIDTNNWPPNPVTVSSKSHNGEDLFKSLGCSACHMINGIGGQVGPDLTKVGSRRNKSWIEEQIKDPQSHNPDSVMPSFKNISDKNINSLADYLSGLK
jgi:nitric oxide reductase subunit C